MCQELAAFTAFQIGIAALATSQVPDCCIYSAPNLRITHAAFVTLSLGGLDGGSQWVILFKSTMSKNS